MIPNPVRPKLLKRMREEENSLSLIKPKISKRMYPAVGILILKQETCCVDFELLLAKNVRYKRKSQND